jgi:FtsH-binding integral membrane protein
MDQNQASRPDQIRTTIKLLYITLGIGAFRSIMEASVNTQIASPVFVMLITFCVLGIMWLLIYKIGKGRNWARITFLVLFVNGLPFSVLPLLRSLAANPISGVLGIGQTVIQIIALVLLFQKPSSNWFREMKARSMDGVSV